MITGMNNDLWLRFFRESGTAYNVEDVTKIISVEGKVSGNEKTEYVGDFELGDGLTIRVKATYLSGSDEISEAKFHIPIPAA